MSAIHPPAVSPLFRAQSTPPALSPVRASRSDFFRAALAAAGAPGEAAPAEKFQSVQSRTGGTESRLQRPGALLDIRV